MRLLYGRVVPDFVAYALRHEPPYLLVPHDRTSTVAAKEKEFELMLRLKCRWPL